jgi:hypothetical protein
MVNKSLAADDMVNVAKLVKGLGGRDHARTARDKGVFTISALLFLAFKEAGGTELKPEDVRSGVEYKKAKDPMHFEVLGKKPADKLWLGRMPVSFADWLRNNREIPKM